MSSPLRISSGDTFGNVVSDSVEVCIPFTAPFRSFPAERALVAHGHPDLL
jgi:hypothetical protein